VTARVRSALRTLWRRLREWSGDAAYDTYLARAGHAQPLTREAFYLESLHRRYQSGQPNRCC
jgi:uncharacterized short protein YbdD (DUF466 family)